MAQADQPFSPSRRGFLRFAPAGLMVGAGLGMTIGKTLDEQIAEQVDVLKELWVKKHGPLHVAEVSDKHKYILITGKLS